MFLPGEFHGQRSLGHKELDMTERLSQMVCVWRGGDEIPVLCPVDSLIMVVVV